MLPHIYFTKRKLHVTTDSGLKSLTVKSIKALKLHLQG